MRIHLATTPNDKPVSFDYQQKLVGVLHKWLGGDNNEHGNMSLYSFSWLQGGMKDGNKLAFTKGAKWFISFYDERRIKQIVRNILDSPGMFSGMSVSDVVIEETPDLSKRNLFYLGSPIFIKKIDKESREMPGELFCVSRCKRHIDVCGKQGPECKGRSCRIEIRRRSGNVFAAGLWQCVLSVDLGYLREESACNRLDVPA